jgi:hypothetical protein
MRLCTLLPLSVRLFQLKHNVLLVNIAHGGENEEAVPQYLNTIARDRYHYDGSVQRS